MEKACNVKLPIRH